MADDRATHHPFERPDLLNDPTRGIDVGTRQKIYRRLFTAGYRLARDEVSGGRHFGLRCAQRSAGLDRGGCAGGDLAEPHQLWPGGLWHRQPGKCGLSVDHCDPARRDGGICAGGGLAAFAGMLPAGYALKAAQAMGDAHLLPASAAVVLGGTSILGGRGSYVGTIAGVSLIPLLQFILSLMQMAEFGRQIIYGVGILAMLLLYGREKRADQSRAWNPSARPPQTAPPVGSWRRSPPASSATLAPLGALPPQTPPDRPESRSAACQTRLADWRKYPTGVGSSLRHRSAQSWTRGDVKSPGPCPRRKPLPAFVVALRPHNGACNAADSA